MLTVPGIVAPRERTMTRVDASVNAGAPAGDGKNRRLPVLNHGRDEKQDLAKSDPES